MSKPNIEQAQRDLKTSTEYLEKVRRSIPDKQLHEHLDGARKGIEKAETHIKERTNPKQG